MRVRVGVRRIILLFRFLFLFGYILYLYFGLFLAEKYVYVRRYIL